MKTLQTISLLLLLGGCARLPPVDIASPESGRERVIVTDIDGTLTPRNTKIHTARPGAAAVLSKYHEKGFSIIYVTARHPLFQWGLQEWLDKSGFPPGALHIAPNAKDRKHVAQYKSSVLKEYSLSGWKLSYAFGDSDTDFLAYQLAGIPKDQVIALQREGASSCQAGCYAVCVKSWIELENRNELDLQD
ncbi:LNS2 domain-containing protein [Ahniella affigens]|nr:HAD family acid phosphatase [Ahniella affigens]